MTQDTINRESERAWSLGRTYGEQNRLADLLRREPHTSRLMAADAAKMGVHTFFDVFKYGAQSVWREKGEL